MEQRRKPSPALLHQIVLADQGPARCDPKETVTNSRFRACQFAAALGGEP